MKTQKFPQVEIEDIVIDNNVPATVEQNSTNQIIQKSSDQTDDDNEYRKNKKSRLPKADIELHAVAKRVQQVWDDKQFPLLWTDKQKIQQLFADYDQQIQILSQDTGEKRPFIEKLRELDDEINKNISKVKSAITAKWGRDIQTSYYSQFGIQKNYGYTLPRNREERIKALKTLVNAISKENDLELYDCDLNYWQGVLDRYIELYDQGVVRTGSVSKIVGQKNVNKKELAKFLNSFIKLIQANYPDTWQHELRNFGFQKERY